MGRRVHAANTLFSFHDWLRVSRPAAFWPFHCNLRYTTGLDQKFFPDLTPLQTKAIEGGFLEREIPLRIFGPSRLSFAFPNSFGLRDDGERTLFAGEARRGECTL